MVQMAQYSLRYFLYNGVREFTGKKEDGQKGSGMGEKDRSSVLRASPNYVYRTIAGQHVLVSIGEGLADFRGTVRLNDTAAFLWEQLQQGRTKEELFRALVDTFDVEEETARRDLDACLELLSSKGMILS